MYGVPDIRNYFSKIPYLPKYFYIILGLLRFIEKGRFDYGAEYKKIKLDVKDKKILAILSTNSRMPLTQIARKTGLSRDAVDYRINRLIKEEIIIRFFPNINYEVLGLYIFHIFFLVDEKDPEEKIKFIEYIKSHPNVFSLIEYTDNWDFEVSIIAKNLIEFDTTILQICSKFPDLNGQCSRFASRSPRVSARINRIPSG